MSGGWENGYVSHISGELSLTDGSVIDYAKEAMNGNIIGVVTLDGVDFEIPATMNELGELVFGEGGNFVTPDGTVLNLTNKAFDYFRVAYVQGVDASGIHQLASLATEVGTKQVAGPVIEMTQNVIQYPGAEIYQYMPDAA